MVRAASEAAASDRVDSSLANRGLTLTQEQRSKVVALPCDLSKHDLGLGESRIQELSTKLTTVIHSAWAVNFNISVSSFEDQHIKAVHNLIQLTLSVQTPRPARFFSVLGRRYTSTWFCSRVLCPVTCPCSAHWIRTLKVRCGAYHTKCHEGCWCAREGSSYWTVGW